MAKPYLIEDVIAPVRGQDMPHDQCPECGSMQIIGYHNGGEYMEMECLTCGNLWEQRLEGVV